MRDDRSRRHLSGDIVLPVCEMKMKDTEMSFTRVAATAAISLLAASQCFASPITETFSFSLGGFADGRSSNEPPSTAVTGVFTVTFDPTISVAQDVADLKDVSVSGVSVNYPYAFSYVANLKLLTFGDVINSRILGTGLGVYILLPSPSAPVLATCDLSIFACVNLTGNRDYAVSNYTAGAPAGSDFFANVAASSVTVTAQGTVSVQEPMSAGLLGVGLAGLGLIRRRMRQSAPVAEDAGG